MHQLELTTIKRQWIDDAASQFALMAHKLGAFTFDELHNLLPQPEHKNHWGCLAAFLRNKGFIRRINAVPSKRPEANGRLISVWQVVTDK